jgi:RHH-type rel operon transcriptional repressor/antitoxin RelB
VVLGLRLDRETDEQLDRVARQTHRTKSDIARAALRQYLHRHDSAYLAEARRQWRAAAAREDADLLHHLNATAENIDA